MAIGRRGSSRGRPGWCVYFLRCGDGSLYAGATNDLPRRLALHAAGKGARYTRSHLPVALAWTERARGRSAALRREAALKRLTRAEKLTLIARPPTPPPARRRAPRPPAPSRRGPPR
jgi:putative endonuclease